MGGFPVYVYKLAEWFLTCQRCQKYLSLFINDTESIDALFLASSSTSSDIVLSDSDMEHLSIPHIY